MVVASASERAAGMRRLPALAGRASLAGLGRSVPPLALALFTLFVFRDELGGGAIAYGRDTTAFYYPLTQWAASELAQGRLPLWNPLIFGGYPILADGEVGPLYPPNLVFLALPFPQAYAWMRAGHFLLAGLGAFTLARVLGCSAFGGLVAGLSFAFGSFMVGHLQHDNILRSASWLPWLLVSTELSLRAHGAGRIAWALLGAVCLALMCLGVHVQPVLLAILLVGAWILAGPFEPASSYPKRLDAGGYLRRRGLIATLVVGLGAALASAQLIPLYFLGLRSLRPGLVTYDYATSFAVSPLQVLTLVFPFMFNFDSERHWALWGPHESTLYVGIAPLILATLAVLIVRTRVVLFLTLVAVVSLLLCFGDYLPVKPYSVIWNLPGFGYLRAPARFSLLLELALACLAALGATWIERRSIRSQVPRGALAALLLWSVLALTLSSGLVAMRWWLQQQPGPALEAFRSLYVLTSKENPLLGPWHVYYGLSELANPGNPKTFLALSLLAASTLLLGLWLSRPKFSGIWRICLACLVALDLGLFAAAFYPHQRPEALRPTSPALDIIPTRPDEARVFVEPLLNQQLGANMLVPRGLATLNGYSSLEPPRFSDYWWSVVNQDNFLLDLFNVRYVLAPRRTTGERPFMGVMYHPTDRLVSGAPSNPAGLEQFSIPPTVVEALVVVSAVEDLGDTRLGSPIAQVELLGSGGERRDLILLAGRDAGEYRAVQPGRPMVDYVGPTVVWAGTSFVPYGTGVPVRLYGATLPVRPPAEVVGMTVRALAPGGRLHVNGLGLRDTSGGVYSVRAADNAKYRRLYEDANVILLENSAARPRLYVVEGARAADEGRTVTDQLQTAPWDPTREILVESVGPADVREATSGAPVGVAELVSFEPARVVARAQLEAPGFLVLTDRFDVGWRAWVGDQETSIVRANSISRAVAVPAGSHTVTFAYDPWWLGVGFALSSVAVVSLGVAVAALAFTAWRTGSRPVR